MKTEHIDLVALGRLRRQLREVGGQALDGSGFEKEMPDSEFTSPGPQAPVPRS